MAKEIAPQFSTDEKGTTHVACPECLMPRDVAGGKQMVPLDVGAHNGDRATEACLKTFAAHVAKKHPGCVAAGVKAPVVASGPTEFPCTVEGCGRVYKSQKTLDDHTAAKH